VYCFVEKPVIVTKFGFRDLTINTRIFFRRKAVEIKLIDIRNIKIVLRKIFDIDQKWLKNELKSRILFGPFENLKLS